MSEAVAKVARDIKAGRVVDPAITAIAKSDPSIVDELRGVHDQLLVIARDYPCPVIDSTPMYEQIVNGPSVNLYDEYRVLPVWENALIGYENQFGNVYIIQTYVIDKQRDYWNPGEWADHKKPPYQWDTPNEVDWDSVRYRFIGVLWAGGMGKGKHVQTTGPLFRWDIACYEDGQMADIRWTALYNYTSTPQEAEFIHQNAMMIWLQTFTLAGCSNVEVVTPTRSKPERKRLERIGIDLKTIVIKKMGKSYRHKAGDTKDMIDGVPQRFVRGHYARYGPEYDRGLLFGKYAGKFWIPARAVGDSGREIDYTPEV